MILRTLFLAILTAALGVQPAMAGDTAQVDILGFSADGGIFAFEEYGIQHGSGFPFANRFYIDTATDTYIAGTPIRVRIDDESATLEDARSQARDQGQSVALDAELEAHRGWTAGWNAITELSADPHRMEVNPRPVVPPIDTPLEVRLREIPMVQPERCRDLGDIVGFGLVRVALMPDETPRTLHEDETVPASRGCPLGYRIGGVQTFFPEGGRPVFAVLIAIRSFGFEGPDHHWMAVVGRL
jgi:predicted secreted protein